MADEDDELKYYEYAENVDESASRPQLEVPTDQTYNLIDLRGSVQDWCFVQKNSNSKDEITKDLTTGRN